MAATLRQLERIAERLRYLAGNFSWAVYRKDAIEIAGMLDPPCHIIRGRLGPFVLDLYADGEWTAADNFGPTAVDMADAPGAIARRFIEAVAEMEPTNSEATNG